MATSCTSYNMFLYLKRMELGYKKKQFARHIGYSTFLYRLIEAGYIKPTKKFASIITTMYRVDYFAYLNGSYSYPATIPTKTSKIMAAIFKFLGKTWVKILFGTLTLLFVLCIPASNIVSTQNKKNMSKYGGETLLSFRQDIINEGSFTFSLINYFHQREIYETGKLDEQTDYLYTIKTPINENNGSVTFGTTYWTDEYRVSMVSKGFNKNYIDVKAVIVEYDTSLNFNATVRYNYNEQTSTFGDAVVIKTSIHSFIDTQAEIIIQHVKELLEPYLDKYVPAMEYLSQNKLSNKYYFQKDIFRAVGVAKSTQTTMDNLRITLLFVGVIFGLASLFLLYYAYMYGVRSAEEINYESRASHNIKLEELKPMRRDIKFTPFIPETILELIGIAIVFIASFRMIIYALYFISGMWSLDSLSSTNEMFMSLFYLGMFLLYFVDFDIFMEDSRVLRNVIMYLLIFLGLYIGESFLISFFVESGSLIYSALASFIKTKIPNMFGSVAMYFAIMTFLYFTPKWANKKWKLIMFRCFSIIPVIIIIISWLIYTCANTYWGWNLSTWQLYLFSSERIPFSILAITYLFGLYFFRLFFEKKYGSERAMRFFNGNKFLWIKNILVCVIIILVSAGEFFFKNNVVANSLGIGKHQSIIFLAPLILFYHPHHGPRNKIVDWITLILYFIAISLSIIIAALLIIGTGLGGIA